MVRFEYRKGRRKTKTRETKRKSKKTKEKGEKKWLLRNWMKGLLSYRNQ